MLFRSGRAAELLRDAPGAGARASVRHLEGLQSRSRPQQQRLAGYWKVVGTPDCTDNPTYPAFPAADGGAGADGSADEAGTDGGAGADGGATSEAGTEAGADGGAAGSDGGATDGSSDASSDGADDTLTLALVDPDGGADAADAAADVPVDAPAGDAPATDAVASNDGSADAGAASSCYEFSYDPDGCQGACWAGVVFEVTDVQGPSADTKGVCIQNGAMAIEFWARSSKDGARVKFGSIGEGMGITEFYLNITKTWARYTVAIPAMDQDTYNTTAGDMQGVWNAFSVVVEPQDYAGGAYIEVKDIHWIAAAN